MGYLILKNCRELLTVKEEAEDLIGLMKNASLLIKDEKVQKIGNYSELLKEIGKEKYTEIDCSDSVVLPGYVDCHTHLIFGKSRVDEYTASLTMSREEIAKILPRVGLNSSIYSTRISSDEELIFSSLEKLNRMLKCGTTTVEIKSGYGIDKKTELRLLRLINFLKSKTSQTIFSTYLGAHSFDMEMGKKKYIDFMIEEVMPVIKEENLAQFCDIWCDDGYYTAEESYRILKSGMDFGMLATMHSECYSAIGGARIATELKISNIGHLNYLKDEDIISLKEAGVVGVGIPTTDFTVKHHKPFNPRPMIEKGLVLAIATNLNPGNWVESMDISIAFACRNHGMTEKEAIRAATLGGAKALKINSMYGSLEMGKFADIQIRKSDSYKNIVYKIGVNEVKYVIKKGEIVVSS